MTTSEIGNADVLDHQEGRSAHDRRHDLAVDRRSHFDRARLLGRSPTFFISGMVKVPVVTTLAMDEPEIRPVMAEDTTAALAGPPRIWPIRLNAT